MKTENKNIIPFTLYSNTKIGFSFIDRVRILFGKETTVALEIQVDKEVEVISSKARTIVAPIIEKKSKQYSDHVSFDC